MPSTASRLAGGAALAGLALTPLFFVLPQSHHAPAPKPRLGNALVAFEPNAGRGPSDVDYYARMGGGTVSISPVQLRLTGTGERALTTTLVGAKPSSPHAEQPLRLRVNSYESRDRSKWRTGLRTFGRVRYGSVYPGVDLNYHGRGARLEYDFVVKPGANPARIALDVRGKGALRVDRAGNLIAGRRVAQLRPVAYQSVGSARRPVRVRFAVTGRTVRFRLGSYDPSRPLVIDPVLTYSDYVGGSSFETGWDVSTDSSGNAYLVGDTQSTSFPGGTQNGSGPGGYILKVAPGGARIWVTFISGPVHGVATGPSGDPYVTGESTGGLPTTPGAAQPNNAGSFDAFIGRMKSGDGTFSWLTYWGGTGGDNGVQGSGSIAVDGAGNAYAAGDSSSTVSGPVPMTTVGAFDTTGDSGGDGWVGKYDANGNRIATTFFGGSVGDNVWAVAVKPSCTSSCGVFIGGQTSSASGFPLSPANPGVIQTTYGGGLTDGYVAKIKSDFTTFDWSTLKGGTGDDYVRGITADSTLGWPTVVGQLGVSGDKQAFLRMYADPPNTNGGDYVFGGSGDDVANDVQSAPGNIFYVAGTTNSSNFPTTTGRTAQPGYGGGGDAFVMKYDANFAATDPVLWSTYLGGGSFDWGYGVSGGADGDVWATGLTASSDFPLVANQQPSLSSVDAFAATIAAGIPAINSGPDGTIKVHEAAFTYSVNERSPTYSCRLSPVEAVFSSCPSSGKSYTGLADGDYTFEVKAADIGGIAGRPAARKFTIDTRPVATLIVSPNPALVGRAVTLDASGSTGAGQALAKFEWDLDGDGSFERDTGTAATTTETYNAPQDHPVSVRVTDAVGASAIQTAQLKVNAAPPLGAQFGVTINNGAQFTRTPDVTVTANFPASTTSMLFSNDGGFLAPSVFPPAKSVKWKLDSSGPERLPKTIYVRFLAGTIPSETFQDDIILDEVPPTVQQAVVTPAAGAAATDAARSAAAKRKWKVRVKAKDSNSGVGRIQVTSNKKKPGPLLRYKRKLTVKSAKRPKWVRARDRAGNYSKWRKAR
jgi:hypothetical protein